MSIVRFLVCGYTLTVFSTELGVKKIANYCFFPLVFASC